MPATATGETATTSTRRRKTTRRRSARRGRRQLTKHRQQLAIARSIVDDDDAAERIVDALNGVGFLRPMTAARRQHVKNLVDITLRGSTR